MAGYRTGNGSQFHCCLMDSLLKRILKKCTLSHSNSTGQRNGSETTKLKIDNNLGLRFVPSLFVSKFAFHPVLHAGKFMRPKRL